MLNLRKNTGKDSSDDADTIAALYLDYRDILFYTAQQILGDYHAAEDVVHEVFVRISARRDVLDFSNNPRSLLITMSKNIAIDTYRKNHHVRPTEGEVLDMFQSSDCFENIIASRELIRDIAAKIDELGGDYSDVFVMRYSQNLSVKQISHLLNISVSTVNRRLSTIRKYIDNYVKNTMEG